MHTVLSPSQKDIFQSNTKDALYKGVSDSVLSRAADRGTAVHSAIEFWLEFGAWDTIPDYAPYLVAFTDWYKSRSPEVLGVELRLYHKLMRYAGTCDLLCRIDGNLCLVDYKTTSAVNRKTCSVQLEAYAQALANAGVYVDRKLILHLTKDGKWREHEFEAKDAESWRVFGACKTIYDYNKK